MKNWLKIINGEASGSSEEIAKEIVGGGVRHGVVGACCCPCGLCAGCLWTAEQKISENKRTK